MVNRKLRVAFIHPDLGIGGAERLVVDAALGLQRLGHSIDIYTSHHDPNHCFEETCDGSLRVHNIKPPFPRSLKGKLHILFAHLRQLHLTLHLLRTCASEYDVYFVDQLSTCVPLLRTFAKKRVVFYCHFPDKLLADGQFVDGRVGRKNIGLLKRIYRLPMDWLEEITTDNADIILANSQFTTRVFKSHFSISRSPNVVYPGINVAAYEAPIPDQDIDITQVQSDRPSFVSLNRFEKKKNAALAVKAFALLQKKLASGKKSSEQAMRLVLAGGYDPRVQDNIDTLASLVEVADASHLRYWITTPSNSSSMTLPQSTAVSPRTADVLLVLNFTASQRSALLKASSTLALLYTPTNEHFGIGPVEGMICGLPVLACNSGGPTETVVASPADGYTGWLVPPVPGEWASTLKIIIELSDVERRVVAARARRRAKENFGMDAMSEGLERELLNAVDMGPVEVIPFTYLLLLCVFVLFVAFVFSVIT